MNNVNAFDESVKDFLNALGLPSRHPYVQESQAELVGADDDPYHEGRGHHEWSVFDYFTPHGHQPSSSKPVGTRHVHNPTTKTFPFCARDECPEQVAASFSSDEKAINDVNRHDWVYSNMQWLNDHIMAVHAFLLQLMETFYQVWPSLRASFHLTLRLFAPLILVVAILYLVVLQFHDMTSSHHFAITSIILQSFLLLIMTDECFIQEYGRVALASVACVLVTLIVHSCPSRQTAILLTAPFILVAIGMTLCCHIYVPRYEPGLYYSQDNDIVTKIVSQWPKEKWTYDDKGTPWLVTGDSRTGIPFFLNFIPPQRFVRRYGGVLVSETDVACCEPSSNTAYSSPCSTRWIPSNDPNEKEACILDIAFPPDGIHRTDKPIYLILHGLNGGSNEEYVKDFCMRATSNGSTVAILVTRGLMDSPVLGENLPHFARMGDIDGAARALKRAAAPHQTLAAVGYSMGAIDLATYVASTGKNCPLDAAVGLSGALDTRKQVDFHRSKRLWQPMLAKTLRDTFLEKFSDRLAKRLSPEEVKYLSKVDSLVTLDEALMVPYNHYQDLNAYYAAMGAMGDFESFDTNKSVGRIANVSIPLVMISALDDPIGYIDTFRDPQQVSASGNGFTMLLLTRTGGHVGWPLGWNPTKHGWKWMSEAATSFVESTDAVLQQERAKRKGPESI